MTTSTRPQRRNANRHTPRGMSALEQSVQSDGWIGAITVAADGETFDGSARLEVAATTGFEDAVVVESDGTKPVILKRTDIPSADDPRAIRLGLAANRVAQLNLDWDADVLAGLAVDVDLSGFWSEDELAALLGTVTQEPATDTGAQVDRAAELQEKWQVERGDLWQIGRHRLLCGDSATSDVDRLGMLPPTLVYDPPWDAGLSVPAGDWSSVLAFCDGRRAADVVTQLGPPTWVFVWDCVTSWYTPSRPLQRMKLCLWYGDIAMFNPDGSHYGDAGDVRTVRNSRGSYTFTPDPRGKHLSDLYSEPITNVHADGPAHSKPLDWLRLLIADCTTGDVYDPFTGTGTTIMACEQVGRTALAVELDPTMVAVTLERLAGAGLTPQRVEAG